MTVLFNYVEKVVWPDKPRGIVTRYGLAVALPLAGVAITHSLFPSDRSPFSPLLALSIVCAAMFGAIQVGVVATASSLFLKFWLCGRRADRPTVSPFSSNLIKMSIPCSTTSFVKSTRSTT